MQNFNAQSVINAINNPVSDASVLLDLDYNPVPMSLSQWAAQAAQSIDDVSLWHFELVSGIYADCGVTPCEFDAVVAEVKALI